MLLVVQHSREETAQDVWTTILLCNCLLQSREAQEIGALRCPGQFRKLLEQQPQNGVKERVVIIFNGPLTLPCARIALGYGGQELQ